ncbi:hypothetical protein ABR2090_0853 [Acinetobacter baumannii]|nr:hypothetical protein ABR2090_0853 [Acinetobacter baumannii]
MRYFFGRKKGTAKPIKTVLGTSQVLLLLQVFSRDDLKPESANGPQTALKLMWCRYSFWQRLPRNNGCAKPTPFYWEFCQSIKIMVAERKRVDRLVKRGQHTQRCPPPVPPQRGHEGVHTKSIKPLMLV